VAAYHELDREIAEAELRTRSHQDAAKACGVSAYRFEASEYEDNMDVHKVLGAQSAYITKLLDTKTSVKDPKVQLEVKKEYTKMATRAFKRIVELKSIPEGAYVVKGKLLVSLNNSEAGKVEDQTIKARLVAMGNVIFDKNLKVRSSLPVHDLWAPVCSMTGVRIVQARASAHRRRSEGIDLVAAYTQVKLGGNIPHFMIIPQVVVDTLDPAGKASG
jgi:hypothetical protein